MKKLLSLIIPAALAMAWAGCQTSTGPHGTVVVKYDQPEKFTDFRSEFSKPTSEVYLKDLREHLEAWAARSVPAGQTLTVTFTDIDMAGDMNSTARESRMIRPIYPLRMKFSWVIKDAGGQVVKEGTESLINDPATTQIGYDRSDPLFYEKSALDTWISNTLR